VGLAASPACAAIRAGVSRLAEHDGYYCLPPEGVAEEAAGEPEPIVAGKVPNLPDDADGPERLRLLGLAALTRVVAEGEMGRKDVSRTALLLSLPAADPAVAAWDLGNSFVPELFRRTGVGDWAAAHYIQAGPAGTFRAIEGARTLLGTGQVDRCLVLAADTYVDGARLAYLDEGWRIRSQRNPDGFLPGEAASAVLLEPAPSARKRKARVLGIVGGASFATEPVPVSADRWSTGRGLAQAIRPLLEGPQGAVGRYMLCNMNGEAYPAREWAVAQMRLAPDLPVVESLQHPADCIGETGTAMAGILVACACEAFRRGHAPATAALAWVGSDDGTRAAAVIRRAP
jgi:3-oxoacyl-[acyl-carrier-protein] synthase-1